MNPENGTPPSGEAYLSSSFIRDAWYVAAWDHEVGSSGVLARTLLGEPLVLQLCLLQQQKPLSCLLLAQQPGHRF